MYAEFPLAAHDLTSHTNTQMRQTHATSYLSFCLHSCLLFYFIFVIFFIIFFFLLLHVNAD